MLLDAHPICSRSIYHLAPAEIKPRLQDIKQAVVESICHLAHGQLGLQSVIDLLACLGDDVRLPSSRITELLAPLDKRMGESLSLLTRVL
ncbi:DUF1484 family protein [Chromobacterium phragmitis]|uniref:DUF1484 domain-containing protein n=1 Tax=Chromobacterium phragmitis TaxID=2202141 RepID=A0A344ULC4_9NEIS|nr:hypothetical protein DK843_18285 [Chromobacterium phragmitis]